MVDSMQTNKKMIWVKLEDILYDLEGDIDDAIVTLQSYKKRYKHNKLRLEIEYYYDSSGLNIEIYRLENDDEYKIRIFDENGLKERIKKEELQTLKDLKNKYEK